MYRPQRVSDPDGLEDRRTRILDAAERCFVRAGVHRTTMQDVAVDAGMSPGNLYRYFASKDALAAGLAERDRAEIGRDFADLTACSDLSEAFRGLAQKHFVDAPREKAVMCLEIWAEATRNPVFAELSAAFERDIRGRLAALIGQAQERGAVAPGVDPDALALVVMNFANGLFVRRAIAPAYEAEREVALLNAVIEAAFAGRIDLGRPVERAEPSLPLEDALR